MGRDVIVLDRPVRPPRVVPVSRTEPDAPRVHVWLVGGYFVHPDRTAWTLVAREGATTHRLDDARLYPFDAAGSTAALVAARFLRDALCPEAIVFRARVVVTERPGEAPEFVAAWTLEGPEPVDVGPYWFER